MANLILASLPRADASRIARRLQNVSLKLKQIVHRAGDPLSHVYFPGRGFFSELTVLANGDMVEVATLGREGIAGWSAGLDGAPVLSTTMVQAEMGTCLRLTVADFSREMNLQGAFAIVVNKYRQAVMGVIMQSTACNAVHSLEQRLGRWLLMAHDRIAEDEFALTQEFVAMMLGATRPTVSVVASALQRAKLISYHRGQVSILDRSGLEAASCECYAASVTLLRQVTRRKP